MAKLSKNVIDSIIKIITDYKKPEKIVIFGSRAAGKERRTSDIDIAVFGKDWTDKDISQVHFVLEEEVDTPLKFDVLNFYSITKESLKKNIINKGQVIYE